MSTGIGVGIAGKVFQTKAGLGGSAPAPAVCPTTYSCSYDGATEFQQGSAVPGFGTSDFSISFWIKTPDPSGAGVNQRIIGKFSGTTQWSIYYNQSTSKFQWVSSGTGTSWNDGYGPHTPVADQWEHIVYSVDRSGNAVWYANGGTPNALDVSSTTIDFGTDGIFYLGRNASGQYFEGNITEVSLWNKALSAAEVLELYNNMSGNEYCLGDLSMGANLTNWWRMFNPSGTYVDPIPNAASGGTITLTNTNMDATNVSTDVP